MSAILLPGGHQRAIARTTAGRNRRQLGREGPVESNARGTGRNSADGNRDTIRLERPGDGTRLRPQGRETHDHRKRTTLS